MWFLLILTLLPLQTSALTRSDARLIGWKVIKDFMSHDIDIQSTTNDFTDEICGLNSKELAPKLTGDDEIGEDKQIKAKINCTKRGNLYNLRISGEEFSAIAVADHVKIEFRFVPEGENGQYLIKQMKYYCFIEERDARLAAYRLINDYSTNGKGSDKMTKTECDSKNPFVAKNQKFVIDEEERRTRDSYSTKFNGKLDNLENSPDEFTIVLLGEPNVKFFFMPKNGEIGVYKMQKLC